MLTKLQAVNKMLKAIGEQPVNTLGSGLADAESAEDTLERVTKEVLSLGWHSNTDAEYDLTPDNDDRITLPDDMLKVDSSGSSISIDVTIRYEDGIRRLYNKDDQTHAFTRTVVADVIWNFPFEELTDPLRNYISAKAARTFQREQFGSKYVDDMLDQEVEEKWNTLLDAEAEGSDANILRDSEDASYIATRNSYRSRIF
jgi:hypothetical protein